MLVEKYVSSKEVRFMANATRLLPVLRRKVQASPAKSVRTLVETVTAVQTQNTKALYIKANANLKLRRQRWKRIMLYLCMNAQTIMKQN